MYLGEHQLDGNFHRHDLAILYVRVDELPILQQWRSLHQNAASGSTFDSGFLRSSRRQSPAYISVCCEPRRRDVSVLCSYRDVKVVVLLHEFLAIRTFTCTWRSEDEQNLRPLQMCGQHSRRHGGTGPRPQQPTSRLSSMRRLQRSSTLARASCSRLSIALHASLWPTACDRTLRGGAAGSFPRAPPVRLFGGGRIRARARVRLY